MENYWSATTKHAQRMHKQLTKHATSSTAAQISGVTSLVHGIAVTRVQHHAHANDMRENRSDILASFI
jgi:hypothetical protein